MLRRLITLSITIIALCYFVPLQADSIIPVSLNKTDPIETKGLTVIQIALPKAPFTQYAQESFESEQWRVVAQHGYLQQVYFVKEEVNDKLVDTVLLYGLIRDAQDEQLTFYYDKYGYEFEQPALTAIIPIAQAKLTIPSNLLEKWTQARADFLTVYRHSDNYTASNQLIEWWLQRAHKVYVEDIQQAQEAIALQNWLNRVRQNYVEAFTQRFGEVKTDETWNTHDWQNNQDWRNRNTDLTAFSLFSGEAAIQETLQKQLLNNQHDNTPATETIADLTGPEVPSHPFERMLAGREGGILPIANLVPADHYFVHITEPRSVLNWLENFSNTGFQIAGLTHSTYLDHNLIDRYLKRFQLSKELIQQLSGQIKQIAIFGPDLYLTDGADLTIVLDITNATLFKTIISPLLGIISEKSVDNVQQYVKDKENPAFYAQQDNWFILSTNRAAVATTLQLIQNQGKESLGQSAEFRYVLAQLQQPADTQGAFIYLSDPFIRHMVGAQTKIAQFRRDLARARLYFVTAANLLYQWDQGKIADLTTLTQLGYIEKSWLTRWEGDEITLDNQGIPHSKLYGTLSNMTPLSKLTIDSISEGERDAYQSYVEDYTNYWRTYFDPIGIRTTMTDPITVETLILPLVQNSIYQTVQATMGGEPVDMNLPNTIPHPISTLSLKLPTEMLLHEVPEQAFLRLLGDTAHIAIYDSQPLITLGSSDLMNYFFRGWFNNDEALWLGMLGAMLTQPTALFFELKEPDKLITVFEQREVFTQLLQDLDFIHRYFAYQLDWVDEANTWIFTLNIENLIRYHLYFQKIGNYLVLSNHLITPEKDVQQLEIQAKLANANLHFSLDQLQQLTANLYLHQVQSYQKVAKSQIEQLLPFFLLGNNTAELAMNHHEMLYGTKPISAQGSEWIWHPIAQRLENNVFGSFQFMKLPNYARDKLIAPTLFDSLKDIDLSFNFEKEGVRIKLLLTPR